MAGSGSLVVIRSVLMFCVSSTHSQHYLHSSECDSAGVIALSSQLHASCIRARS